MTIFKKIMGFICATIVRIIGLLFIIGFFGFFYLNLPIAIICLLVGIVCMFIPVRKKTEEAIEGVVEGLNEWADSEPDYSSDTYDNSFDVVEDEAPEFDYTFTKDNKYVFIQKSVSSDRFYSTPDGEHRFIRFKSGIYSEI